MTLTLRKSLVSLAGRPFALQRPCLCTWKDDRDLQEAGVQIYKFNMAAIFQHCGDAKRLFGHSVVCEKAIHFDN